MYRSLSQKRVPKTDKNVILDIDETLLYSHDVVDDLLTAGLLTDLKYYKLRHRLYTIEFEDGEKMWGLTRPGFDDFLDFCFQYFKHVIIWTAGCREYADKVVNFLFRSGPKPSLVLCKDDCTHIRGKPKIKDLKQLIKAEPWLGLTLENTFVIDDRDHTFKRNPDNAIHIPEFSFTKENERSEQDEKDERSEQDEQSEPEEGVCCEKMMAMNEVFEQIQNWLLNPEVIYSKDVKKLNKTNIFD
jgi:TFIIF-interacting CTD phosphatase-like protein